MSDLAIVESPLQLLNAAEAARQFKDDAKLLILVTRAFSKTRFEALLDHMPIRPWSSIRYLQLQTTFPMHYASQGPLTLANHCTNVRSRISRAWNRMKLRSALKSLSRPSEPPKRVFVGNYIDNEKPYFRYAANAFEHSETVLLDDGTDAIIVAAQRRRHHEAASGVAPPDHTPLHWRAINWTRSKITGWNETPRNAVTFFSSFDLDVQAPDRLVKHSYEALRPTAAHAKHTNEVWILGQSLPDDEYMDLNVYVDSVRNMIRRIEGGEFVYIAHPRESKQTLAMIESALRIKIRHFAIPIELVLLRSEPLPTAVASFFSTALVNIGLILGDSMVVYSCILDAAVLHKHHQHVADIYATMLDMKLPSLQFIRNASMTDQPSTA